MAIGTFDGVTELKSAEKMISEDIVDFYVVKMS